MGVLPRRRFIVDEKNRLNTVALSSNVVALYDAQGIELKIFVAERGHVEIEGKEALRKLHDFLGKCIETEYDFGE